MVGVTAAGRELTESSHEAPADADPVVVVLELAAVDEVLVSFGLAAYSPRQPLSPSSSSSGLRRGVVRSCLSTLYEYTVSWPAW